MVLIRLPEALRGPRLTLRCLGPADLDVVHALFSSPGHTIGDGPIHDERTTLAWLQRRQLLREQSGLTWYGLWDDAGQFVGTCGTLLGRHGHSPEIGYEINLPHRRRGYATEAVGLVTAACHEAGHRAVWASIRPTNSASARTLVSNGFDLVRVGAYDGRVLQYYRHLEPATRD